MRIQVSFLTLAGHAQTQSYEWDSGLLENHLKALCEMFGADRSFLDYVLEVRETGQLMFGDTDITLERGSEVILRLIPELEVQELIKALTSDELSKRKKAFFSLSKSRDYHVCTQLLQQNGLAILLDLAGKEQGGTLSYALQALGNSLLLSGNWTDVPESLVNKIVCDIDTPNITVSRASLDLLVDFVLGSHQPLSQRGDASPAPRVPNSEWKSGSTLVLAALRAEAKAQSKAPFENLLALVSGTFIDQQTLSLRLINALLAQSDAEQFSGIFSELDALHMKKTIYGCLSNEDVSFRREILKFQRHVVQAVQIRKNVAFDVSNPEHEAMLQELWTRLYPTVTYERVSKQWGEVGFQGKDPITDFRGMGMLGLENLVYMARNCTSEFKQIVRVQSKRDEDYFPVAVGFISVSSMLCDLLSQGIPDDPPDISRLAILLDHENAFEELYCTCCQVLNRMFDEMEATYMDFGLVLKEVQRQIADVLASNTMGVRYFQKAAFTLSHSAGRRKTVKEVRESDTVESEAVKELREKVRTEISQIVGNQRLGYLLDGGFFRSPTKKTIRFVQLSQTQKEVLYADAEESGVRPAHLTTSIPVSSIAMIVTGRQCPSFSSIKNKDATKGIDSLMCFAILTNDGTGERNDEGVTGLEFICSDQAQFDGWTDGIRVLMGSRMEAPLSIKFVEELVSVETRVRMISLGEEAPPVPEPPADFLFCG